MIPIAKARGWARTSFIAAIAAAVVAASAIAKPVCVDGVCYPSEEDAIAAGAKLEQVAGNEEPAPRLAMGYMDADAFLEFLSGEGGSEPSPFETAAPLVALALAFLAGLALNLTPCVLPLVPVTVIVIGRSFRRGLAYAAGIALAYGALGVAAAFGGLAFGAIQGLWYFNAAVAAVFVALALAMFDVFNIDFSRLQGGTAGKAQAFGAFGMGLLNAVLAGACVAPAVVAVVTLAAGRAAAGDGSAAFLPFALGLGMAAPWPFVAAGVKVLPKPGRWMLAVKKVLGCLVLVLAAHYGWLAVRPFLSDGESDGEPPAAQESRAGDSAKPLLVEISAPWCKNCTAMEKTVFTDPRVREAMKSFEFKKIMIDDFADLARYPELGRLQIRGVPAFVIFAP